MTRAPLAACVPAASCRHLTVGFWVVAAVFAVVIAEGAVSTPLYVLSQHRDGLSYLLVAVVVAAYAVGAIASLLLGGHVSDWVGRRRVLVPALVASAGSASVIAAWPSLIGLLAGRVLAGLAVGSPPRPRPRPRTAPISAPRRGRAAAAGAPRLRPPAPTSAGSGSVRSSLGSWPSSRPPPSSCRTW